MDRMDCQFLMALCTWVHYNTFVKIATISVPKLTYMYHQLNDEEKKLFLESIMGKGRPRIRLEDFGFWAARTNIMLLLCCMYGLWVKGLESTIVIIKYKYSRLWLWFFSVLAFFLVGGSISHTQPKKSLCKQGGTVEKHPNEWIQQPCTRKATGTSRAMVVGKIKKIPVTFAPETSK